MLSELALLTGELMQLLGGNDLGILDNFLGGITYRCRYAVWSMGMELNERLFTRMQREDRNIAVMFMGDMSGSTQGWINQAEREALVLLCESL